MRVRNVAGNKSENIEIPMTPMIDIVFQLLVFFIMTFKIVSQEGDFNIRMPLAAMSEGPPPIDKLPPMVVRMQADSRGNLAQISLNQKAMGTSVRRLHDEIRQVIGDDRGPGSVQETAEVELDCDYNLRYEHVIEAVTAVSGYLDGNGNIVKLAEKIKFAPPRAAP
jgi:biopolymer transport protein ExbD